MPFKSIKFSYLLLATVLGIVLGVFLNKAFSGDNLRESIRKFNDVLTFTEKYYVEEVDTQKLVESAINGIAERQRKALLDPHQIEWQLYTAVSSRAD